MNTLAERHAKHLHIALQAFAVQRIYQLLAGAKFPTPRTDLQRKQDLYRIEGRPGFRAVSAGERAALIQGLEREEYVNSLRRIVINNSPQQIAESDQLGGSSSIASTEYG